MGIIYSFFGVILNIIFMGVTAICSPVGALAISIIIFTIVARVLLTPLQISSQRTTRGMSKVQPELAKIQKKYEGRKDQQSQLEQSKEMQALYKKYKINPFAGCLPLLIQFPLIIGLFAVLRQPATYINSLGAEYDKIAGVVQNLPNYQELLEGFRQSVEVASRVKGGYDITQTHQLGQFLSHLTSAQWGEFLGSITQTDITTKITEALTLKNQYEQFFSVNVVDTPAALISQHWWVIIMPILAGASSYIFSKISMAANNTQVAGDSKAAAQTNSMMTTMNIVMPIMSGVFAYTMPIGLAIYWIAGNVIMLGQQYVVNKILEKQDAKLEAQLAKDREEARKNNKITTKKVMKKVPVQKKPEDNKTEDDKPKTYTKTVIKKVPVQKNTDTTTSNDTNNGQPKTKKVVKKVPKNQNDSNK